MIRLFYLQRDEDETGISGTGRIADGIEFSDGSCVVHWLTYTSSTNFYSSLKDVEALHGHGGKTKVVWIFEERTR